MSSPSASSPPGSSAASPPEGVAAAAEDAFTGAEGLRIVHRHWLPEGAARATVVIAHGLGEHGGRYRYVVETLVPAGYAVHAIDHRGHGRSEGRRAQIGRLAHVVADLDRLVDLARRRQPDHKLFLLGHSWGGLVSIAYALHHQEKLDGLALSGPLAALDAAPAPLRLLARLLSLATPDAGLLAIDPKLVSRDHQEVRAYVGDPLNFHGKLPARTLQEIADAVGGLPSGVDGLTLPLLVQLGSADGLAAPHGGRMVHDGAGATDKTLHVYDGFFHEIYNELPGERERPLGDLRAWLDARAEA